MRCMRHILAPRTVYYVVTKEKKILGGGGIAPLKDGDPSVCELQKMYFSPKARGKILSSKMDMNNDQCFPLDDQCN